MSEQDTVKLLREGDAGIRMGVAAIDEVAEHAGDSEFRQILLHSRERHRQLQHTLLQMLARYGADGKEPAPAARGMSWIKTNAKLSLEKSDQTIADLVIDGCDMGVKSLHRYLNQYAAAAADARELIGEVIRTEKELASACYRYL
ncbi:MAG: hypothetical protein Q4B96_03300 [Bacillota bacterium]|nr:hypothetical protein [Bacillota bacterium]